MLILVTIAVVWTTVGVVLLVDKRERQVMAYRLRMVRLIGKAANNDVNNFRPWEWRFKEFDKVTATEMILKFWKPLHSFWPSLDFIFSHGRESGGRVCERRGEPQPLP